jgi:hypothetical protein
MNPNDVNFDENQPIDTNYVNPTRIDKIKKEARELSRFVAGKSLNEIESLKSNLEIKYKYLKENVPKLFEVIVEKRFERRNFEFMLNSLERLMAGTSTMHQENVNVGTVLVDKYVKPNLSKNKK